MDGKQIPLTLRKLGAAIGRNHSQLSKLAKNPGFPSHVINGERRYFESEVRDWLHRNIRGRKELAANAVVTNQVNRIKIPPMSARGCEHEWRLWVPAEWVPDPRPVAEPMEMAEWPGLSIRCLFDGDAEDIDTFYIPAWLGDQLMAKLSRDDLEKLVDRFTAAYLIEMRAVAAREELELPARASDDYWLRLAERVKNEDLDETMRLERWRWGEKTFSGEWWRRLRVPLDQPAYPREAELAPA